MKVIARLFFAVCLVVLSAIFAFAATEIREGKWEISTAIDTPPSMPFKIPPIVISYCYTKDDVKDEKKIVANNNNECTVTDMKRSGNKVTWKMKCTGKNKGTFKGETIFGEDFYDSIMYMQSEEGSITTKIKAKRIGACSD